MLINLALATTFFLFAPSSYAKVGHTDQTHPVEREESPHWLQEIKAQVRVFPKDVDLYHWGKLSEFGGLDGEMHRRLQQFYNNDGTEKTAAGTLGDGLYLSSDPISTLEFGGGRGNFVLLKMPVKAGTRFLDLRQYRIFSKAAQSEIIKAGCPIKPYDLNPSVLNLMSDNPPCRALLLKAIKSLGISFLSTYYDGPNHIDAIIPGYRALQLILTSDAGVDRGQLRAFTPKVKTPDPDASDRSLIEGVYDYYLDRRPPTSHLWPKVKPASQSAVDDYLRARIFSLQE